MVARTILPPPRSGESGAQIQSELIAPAAWSRLTASLKR